MGDRELLNRYSGACRPILVTGTNRSGTTWLGKMLDLAAEVLYVHEPFNPQAIPFTYHLVRPPFKGHFHYVTDSDREATTRYLKHRLGLFYPWWQDVKVRPDIKRGIGATLRWQAYWKIHRSPCRPLIKDPLALMSVEWLLELLDPNVIISVRHPAAYVSSIKRLNWDVGPKLFLPQPELCETYLQPFMDDLHALAASPERDIVGEAIVAWRIFHHVIHLYQKAHPEFIVVRTEDLSRDPAGGYRNLFDRLALPFTNDIRDRILAYSSANNPKEAGRGRADQIARDSRATISVWKQRLSPTEIDRIQRETEDIAPLFYGD
ncbi:MAG: sulfotransferase, partial [Cyanobacteria bacterium J06639_1]